MANNGKNLPSEAVDVYADDVHVEVCNKQLVGGLRSTVEPLVSSRPRNVRLRTKCLMLYERAVGTALGCGCGVPCYKENFVIN